MDDENFNPTYSSQEKHSQLTASMISPDQGEKAETLTNQIRGNTEQVHFSDAVTKGELPKG